MQWTHRAEKPLTVKSARPASDAVGTRPIRCHDSRARHRTPRRRPGLPTSTNAGVHSGLTRRQAATRASISPRFATNNHSYLSRGRRHSKQLPGTRIIMILVGYDLVALDSPPTDSYLAL